MKIQWLGHSCFKLTESTGTTVVIDPYKPYFGLNLSKQSCDIVTVSHKHDDHSHLDAVTDYKFVLDNTGGYEIDGIHAYSVMSYHDSKKGADRGKNLVFKFRIDGVEVCHLGDIGEELSPLLAEMIAPINVLLIPIGGQRKTIDSAQAKEYIDLLMPDIAIPMHYKSDGSTMDLDNLDDFLEFFDDDDIVYHNEKEIEFNRTDFDDERTKVIVMKNASL